MRDTDRPPLVSVVMSTFNRLALVPATVASVQAHTLREWRLIIGDDDLDENTRSCLSEHTQDGRIDPVPLRSILAALRVISVP
jgi:glycosyltransferase involved in cell wall biosynthesis